MPAILKIVTGTLGTMLLSLLSEKMLKWLIIWGLEKVVARTHETWDDELLARAKEAWAESGK